MVSLVTVRYAVPSDAPTIAEFNSAMAFETEHRQLDRERLLLGVETLLASPAKGFYLVAERDNLLIGQLMVTYEWSDWRNGTFWWIQSVYVRPSHRRIGVFARLFQHVSDLSRSEAGVCGLRLYVERNNFEAQQTYRRMGMHRTEYDLYEIDNVLGKQREETVE